MKMLIRLHGLPAPFSSRISTTRPSAGDTSRPAPEGIGRSGSRKKFRTNSASRKKKTAARKKNLAGHKNPMPSSPPPATTSGKPYQYPSFTIAVGNPPSSLRSPADPSHPPQYNTHPLPPQSSFPEERSSFSRAPVRLRSRLVPQQCGHPILKPQFEFLQPDFLKLFRLGQIRLCFESFQLGCVTAVLFLKPLVLQVIGHRIIPDGLGRGAHWCATSISFNFTPRQANTHTYRVQAENMVSGPSKRQRLQTA